jgi:hypothetical protein
MKQTFSREQKIKRAFLRVAQPENRIIKISPHAAAAIRLLILTVASPSFSPNRHTLLILFAT